jgi:glucokinase
MCAQSCAKLGVHVEHDAQIVTRRALDELFSGAQGSRRRGGGTVDVVVAVDVGGTGMKCALVDRANRIVHAERHRTPAERGPDAVIVRIQEVVSGLAETARAAGMEPVAVGLAVPGVIDEPNGIAAWSANVGFRNVPLRDLVQTHIGLPTVLGHDVRAGGIAEARIGAGRGVPRVWFVPVGTGIAAAYVVDGRCDPGAHGASGEIGHVVVRPDGPACACGARGCVEAIASASAIGRQYSERTGETATARDVVERAGAGDEVAAAVWANAVDALADGLRIGITLHDPDTIIIGGGLAESGAALLGPLDEAVRGRLTFQTMPALVKAELGDEAGCLGSALLGWEAA